MKTLKELLNKDEIGELWQEWKKDEFGNSPGGFDTVKIDGASLFADFIRKKLR